EVVAIAQRCGLVLVNETGGMQGVERFPGVGGPQGRQPLAIFQLKELDKELHVNDAAEASLEITLAAAGLNARAPGGDLVRGLASPSCPIRAMLGRGQNGLAKLSVAIHHARPGECLPFPELAVALFVITAKLGQRSYEAA